MRAIWMLSVADDSGNWKTCPSAGLHRQHFLDPSAIGPFQDQPEWKLGNLVIVGNSDPATITIGKSLKISVDDAPKSA
jgi:hypothetical protein